MKTRSHHVIGVDCRTRDPEVLSSNPGVAKKKISHRSNQNNTTTNLSAPELNTWNCQRWKTAVAVVQCYSAALEIQRSSVQTLVWPKRKSLTGPIRTIPPPIPYTRLKYPILLEVKPRSCSGAVVECRIRDTEVPSSNPGVAKRKSLTGPIRTIPPPIPLHQT